MGKGREGLADGEGGIESAGTVCTLMCYCPDLFSVAGCYDVRSKLNLERSCSNGGGRIWHAEALLPSSIKALDRLIGALAHIPIAWLNHKKAKIELQTQAYALVEASIGKVAASEAGADKETVQRALDVLVRKEYRRCRKESWRSFSKAIPG